MGDQKARAHVAAAVRRGGLEEVNIAIAVSQLDGADGRQTADWAKALRMSIQPWS